jgi:hypothetical protein
MTASGKVYVETDEGKYATTSEESELIAVAA